MEDAYAQVCAMFGENPKVTEPADFFKAFIDFIANFKVFFFRICYFFSRDVSEPCVDFDKVKKTWIDSIFIGSSIRDDK